MGSGLGGGRGDPIFLHESSSWVEIRLHTEFGGGRFGLWCGFVVEVS